MRTVLLYDGDLGAETMLVRCDLSQAAAPVEVDYRNGEDKGWEPTQYQCADTRHTVNGLARIAMELAARAVGMASEEFKCEWELTKN